MTQPNSLGGLLPRDPEGRWLIKQLKLMQQQITQLQTANPQQALATAAVVPVSVNADNSTVTLPDVTTPIYACYGGAVVPAGYSSLLAVAVGAVGGTAAGGAGGYVYAQMAIGQSGTAPGAGTNAQGNSVAAWVPAGAGNSATAFFSTVMTGLTVGEQIVVGVLGSKSGATFTGGNGHISAMILFSR